MRWYRIPAKLVRLPRSQVMDMFLAQWALLQAQVTVWIRPRGALLLMTSTAAGDDCSGSGARARALDLAVRRVVRFGPLRPQCLVRALALHRLLTRAGIRGSRVRIGVRLTEAEFTAHAWVVWDSTVFGDDLHHVGRFAAISDGRTVS